MHSHERLLVIIIIIISVKWTKWMAEIMCSFDACVCVWGCAGVRAQRSGQSDQFKTVEATVFKFDVDVPRDSPDMIP